MRPLTCIFLASVLVTLALCSSAKENESDELDRLVHMAKDTGAPKSESTKNKKTVARKEKKEVHKSVKKTAKEAKETPAKKELDLEGLPEEMKQAIQSVKVQPV